MNDPSDNRALTALFRVFGGEEKRRKADAHECPNARGMHPGEYRVLSILVPLSLWIVMAGWLSSSLGNVAGWLLALPTTFLALNLLPLAFGSKSQRVQWWFALVGFMIWAGNHCHLSGIPGILSHVWIGMGIMNLAASLVLAWRASMRWTGTAAVIWRIALLVILHSAAIAAGFKYGWPWALVIGALIACLFCWAVLNPGCQWLGTVYRTVGDDRILITIDDGPDPHDTPVMLDLLDLHQTKAVFFMIGEKVRAYPELAREVVRRGHEIGNHTLTHPAGSFWCAGPWWTRREIAGCQEVIREVTGIAPRLFRAPVGHRNLFTHPVTRELGLEVMAWNRRCFDALAKDPKKVLARILPDLSKGDIVLLHESTPIATQVLAGVLENLRK
jgi:peptidoglycan/xylan/chitin deacetylase (PgdA/CDA1 family)